jgi:hypothetical protein
MLRDNLQDTRVLRLLAGALQAGYGAAWTYPPSLSGSPQGGRGSPLRATIYLARLERGVHATLLPAYTRGTRRQAGAEDRRRPSLATSYRNPGSRERAAERRKALPPSPSVDPHAEAYRRLRSVRYADAVVLGEAGTMAEATDIKAQSAALLSTPRHLTLSAAQTLLTHARPGRARWLGSASGTMDGPPQFDKRRQRAGNGTLGLDIPEDVLPTKRTRYLRDGKAQHRTARMNDSA